MPEIPARLEPLAWLIRCRKTTQNANEEHFWDWSGQPCSESGTNATQTDEKPANIQHLSDKPKQGHNHSEELGARLHICRAIRNRIHVHNNAECRRTNRNRDWAQSQTRDVHNASGSERPRTHNEVSLSTQGQNMQYEPIEHVKLLQGAHEWARCHPEGKLADALATLYRARPCKHLKSEPGFNQEQQCYTWERGRKRQVSSVD